MSIDVAAELAWLSQWYLRPRAVGGGRWAGVQPLLFSGKIVAGC